ncbi:MAG: trigger factor [Myxococcota bacterium]
MSKNHPIEATKTESGPCEYKISVTVPAERVTQEFNHAYQSASRGMKIPGFRPGKAPASVLRQMLGDDLLSHAKEHLLEHVSNDALSAVGLRNEVLRMHEIDADAIEVVEDTAVSFEFSVETVPQVVLPNFSDIEVSKEDTTASDEQLAEALQGLAGNHQQFEVIEDGELNEDHCALVDLTYSYSDEDLEANAGLRFTLGSPLYGADPEKFDAALTGTSAGSTFELDVEFKEGFQNADWVGKTGIAKITVNEIQKARMATPVEIAEALGLESEEVLNERLNERIQLDNDQQERQRQAAEILGSVYDMNPFDLPSKMIEEESEATIERHMKQMQQQGASEEDAQKEADKQRDDVRKDSEKRLQNWFVLRKFGQQEKIRVTSKDLDMAYRSVAAQQGMDVKMVKDFYKSQDMVDNLRSEIHESKVRSHIVDQVLKANQAEAVDSVKA